MKIVIIFLSGIILMFGTYVQGIYAKSDCIFSKPENSIAEYNLIAIDSSYTFSKQYIVSVKSGIRQERIAEDFLSRLFTKLLTDRIIPYWLGTPGPSIVTPLSLDLARSAVAISYLQH